MALDAGTRLIAALARNQQRFSPILGFALTTKNARSLNLSVANKELQKYERHEDYVRTLDHVNFIWYDQSFNFVLLRIVFCSYINLG